MHPWGGPVWPQSPGFQNEGMKSKLFANKCQLGIAALLLLGSLGDGAYGLSLPRPNMKV